MSPQTLRLEELRHYRIALLLPCLNEELTITKVIEDFRRVLPQLEVYVFDNGSTDRSAQRASEAGATVIPVARRGKGHVVRKMFESVEADYFVMVDSDDTYEAEGLLTLMTPVVLGRADMVVASRLSQWDEGAFRKFHRFGNALIIRLINIIFGSQLIDVCSGYRVMNRHFVKNIPLLRDGFEVETELTIYSLINGFSILEIPLPYRKRPINSFSKLRTFRDGYKVLLTIVWLIRDLRPLLFFATFALALFFGLTLPLAHFGGNSFAVTSLAVFSVGLFMTGLVLNTINVKFQELQGLSRRSIPGSGARAAVSAMTPPPTRRRLSA